VFAKGGQKNEIAVEGSLIVNDIDSLMNATVEGVGIAYLPEPMVQRHLVQGRLIRLLDEWSNTLPGIFLYHPSRHQTPMPLQVFLRYVEKWRKRALVSNQIPRWDDLPMQQSGSAIPPAALDSEPQPPQPIQIVGQRAARGRKKGRAARSIHTNG
jgi:hypothetical protein